jgi:hypothetical protein
MAMRQKAWRPRWAGPGPPEGGANRDPLSLEVWEWEGGACGEAAPPAHSSHASFEEHAAERRRDRSVAWAFLSAAARALRPRGYWTGFLALGAGIVAVGLLERARQR